jgi:hypothetical protein
MLKRAGGLANHDLARIKLHTHTPFISIEASAGNCRTCKHTINATQIHKHNSHKHTHTHIHNSHKHTHTHIHTHAQVHSFTPARFHTSVCLHLGLELDLGNIQRETPHKHGEACRLRACVCVCVCVCVVYVCECMHTFCVCNCDLGHIQRETPHKNGEAAGPALYVQKYACVDVCVFVCLCVCACLRVPHPESLQRSELKHCMALLSQTYWS